MQKPRVQLWLNDGSCVRLRPEHENHVALRLGQRNDPRWRSVCILNLIDESTRECLMISAQRRSSSLGISTPAMASS